MKKQGSQLIKFMIFAATVNLFLAALKLIGGLLGDSDALISDAIHSVADVLSSLIVLVGIYYSQKNIDASHTYGHERLECVASLLLSILLFFTGITIGENAVKAITSGTYKNVVSPNSLALVAAAVSISVKECMFWFTLIFYKRTGLISLKADAWHQRIDALSSVGSLLGIIGAMSGFPICDTIASLLICLFILKISIEIFTEACNRMVDKACDPELENTIKSFILLCDGVLLIYDFKSRLFGAKVIIEAEIAVESDLSLSSATKLADKIQNLIIHKFDVIKSCRIIPLSER